MKLTVLGCSGSVPGPNSPASGYLVESERCRIAMDFGNGVFGALQRIQDPFSLNAVLLSHLHPDHCADLASLLVYFRYHPDPRWARRVALYGPSGLANRISGLYEPNVAARQSSDLSDVYSFHEWDRDPVRIGPFTIRAFPVHHSAPAFGIRVTANGRTLAYTGDAGPGGGLADAAADADVLLAEASWEHSEDKPDGVHLSGKQAGELAETSGVGRLLLTHVPPWTSGSHVLAEARAVYRGSTELVHAGAEYSV